MKKKYYKKIYDLYKETNHKCSKEVLPAFKLKRVFNPLSDEINY